MIDMQSTKTSSTSWHVTLMANLNTTRLFIPTTTRKKEVTPPGSVSLYVKHLKVIDPACARKTFAEPFADLTVAHARRTNRQASRLRAIAKELGDRPAARESENVLIPVSRHTLLRL